MMSIGLHCRAWPARPGRAQALRRRARPTWRGNDGVWFATRLRSPSTWAATHPAPTRIRPSEMGPRRLRGGIRLAIFGHSPWIAERGPRRWNLAPPMNKRPDGRPAALARIFRTAPEAERLGVLRAHPRSCRQTGRRRRPHPRKHRGTASGRPRRAERCGPRNGSPRSTAPYTAKFGLSPSSSRCGDPTTRGASIPRRLRSAASRTAAPGGSPPRPAAKVERSPNWHDGKACA